MNSHKNSLKQGFAVLPIIIIVVVLALAAGGYMMMKNKKTTVEVAPQATTEASLSPIKTPSPTYTTADMTDDKLTTEEANVDAKVKALDTESTSIDAGLNDKQGALSE